MPSGRNLVVVATAGSLKTQGIIDSALAITNERVLIATYTLENQRQIVRRISDRVGSVPANIAVMGWFGFLIAHGARPYQRALTGVPGRIRGLNFEGKCPPYTKKTQVQRYYLDAGGNMYRDGVADFVCQADAATGGAVVARIERVFPHIFIDEVQDLSGYDLDVLDLLFASRAAVIAVGDLRQRTYSTTRSSRHKKYRGAAFLNWLRDRESVCQLEERNENFRCHQAICDLADSIFPEFTASVSRLDEEPTGHDGVFMIRPDQVLAYYETHQPLVLRHSVATPTQGLPAINIGVSKGSTFERVLIFPTKPMLQFLADGDPSILRDRARFYVAVTRAKHSVAFVVP